MAYKKKPQNKSEKKPVENKAPKAAKPVAIDWNSLPLTVKVVALKHKHLEEGKEYSIPKDQAQLLVGINAVKLA